MLDLAYINQVRILFLDSHKLIRFAFFFWKQHLRAQPMFRCSPHLIYTCANPSVSHGAKCSWDPMHSWNLAETCRQSRATHRNSMPPFFGKFIRRLVPSVRSVIARQGRVPKVVDNALGFRGSRPPASYLRSRYQEFGGPFSERTVCSGCRWT